MNEIRLRTYEEFPEYKGNIGEAYVELRDFPHANPLGCVKKSIDIHNLIDNYYGPRLCLDFNEDGIAIGIEILYGGDDDD